MVVIVIISFVLILCLMQGKILAKMVNTRYQPKNYVRKKRPEKKFILTKLVPRIQKLCYAVNVNYVDPVSITLKVVNGLYPGVTIMKLDILAVETAAMMSTIIQSMLFLQLV